MKKTYQKLLALGIAATSFAACSRGNYAVNQHTLPPTSSQQLTAPATPDALETTARVTAIIPATTAPETTLGALAVPKASTAKAHTVAGRPAARPKLVQQLLIKKVTRQLAKAQATHQNTTQVAQTASKAGRAGLVILVGLAVILIGGLIGGANIVVTIGGAIFVVGLILLLIALIKG